MYSSLGTVDIEHAYVGCFGKKGVYAFLSRLKYTVIGGRKWYDEDELNYAFNQKNPNLHIEESNQLITYALRYEEELECPRRLKKNN